MQNIRLHASVLDSGNISNQESTKDLGLIMIPTAITESSKELKITKKIKNMKKQISESVLEPHLLEEINSIEDFHKLSQANLSQNLSTKKLRNAKIDVINATSATILVDRKPDGIIT